MGAIIVIFYHNWVVYIWSFKIQILAGLFTGITIYLYCYSVIRKRKKNIIELKNINSEIIRKLEGINAEICNDFNKIYNMSETEQKHTRELMDLLKENTSDFKTEITNDFKDFKQEVRGWFKVITDKMTKNTKELTDYMISNNNRISMLEGDNKVTKSRIAIYITIGSTFLMMAINLYMSIKG